MAFLGFDEVDGVTKKQVKAGIKKAKKAKAAIIIVSFHWGIERDYYPARVQKSLGRYAIDCGASLVLDHHPHVLQGIEEYKGRYIVHSLGNFCFGGNSNPEDKDCMLFQQTFTVAGDEVAKNDDVNFIACSVSSESDRNTYQPTIAEGDEKARIDEKIQESNDEIAQMAADLPSSGSDEGGEGASDAAEGDGEALLFDEEMYAGLDAAAASLTEALDVERAGTAERAGAGEERPEDESAFGAVADVAGGEGLGTVAATIGGTAGESRVVRAGEAAGELRAARPGEKSAEAMFAEAIASTLGVVDKIDFDSLTFETDDE